MCIYTYESTIMKLILCILTVTILQQKLALFIEKIQVYCDLQRLQKTYNIMTLMNQI